MKGRALSDFLQDILDGIQEIEAFTTGIDFESFKSNREKILAIIKLLEILGEAVGKIPEAMRQQYPNINWKEVVGMRNSLVHEYWGVDVGVVWATVQEDVPVLKETIREMLKSLSYGK